MCSTRPYHPRISARCVRRMLDVSPLIRTAVLAAGLPLRATGADADIMLDAQTWRQTSKMRMQKKIPCAHLANFNSGGRTHFAVNPQPLQPTILAVKLHFIDLFDQMALRTFSAAVTVTSGALSSTKALRTTPPSTTNAYLLDRCPPNRPVASKL